MCGNEDWDSKRQPWLYWQAEGMSEDSLVPDLL